MAKNPRFLILRADVLARAGQFAEAVVLYDSAAKAYADMGFALRAIAIWRTIVRIVDDHAPQLADARSVAFCHLLELYSELGLQAQADELRRLLD